jgi:hypothetical protein
VEQAINAISTRYQKGKDYFSAMVRKGKIASCSPGFVSGSCKCGGRYAAIQYCGKEYCPDCSRDGSPIHQRRVNKWFSYVKDWQSVGYIVITLPVEVRYLFLENVELLKDLRYKVLRKLKDKKGYNFNKGLARFHWFGDCENCKGEGCPYCKNTGAADFWHPHLNILVPGSFIKDIRTYFEPLRRWLANYLLKLVDAEIDKYRGKVKYWDDEIQTELDYLLDARLKISSNSMIINYSYVTEPAAIMNRVKYVTRSTFRRYNSDIKRQLYNFRNSIVYGWKRGEVEYIEEPTFCPICLEKGLKHPIHWGYIKKYNINQKIKIYEKSTGNQLVRISTGNFRNNELDIGFIPIFGFRTNKKVSRYNPCDEGVWTADV